MGYLFILIGVLAGSIKGFCGKKTSSYVEESSDAMFVNGFRMVLCVVIGFLLLLAQNSLQLLAIDGTVLWITLLSGITTSLFVVTWILAVKTGAYVMLDVFLMLGVAVPLGLCWIFFNETIRPIQLVGLAILLAAVLIMCSYNNKIKTPLTKKGVLLLVVCGTVNGLTSFSQKLFVKLTVGSDIAVFNFYTYLFSALVLYVCYGIFSAKSRGSTGTVSHQPVKLRGIAGYIAVMSVCLFANSYFLTKAAAYLNSAEIYPLQNALALIFSACMSSLFFKEKMTIRSVVGIVLAFVALLFINLL